MKLSICQAFAEQSSSRLWWEGSLWGFAVGGILVAGTHTLLLVHPPSKSSNHPKLPCCASLLLLSFTSSCYEGGGFFLLLGRRWLVWRLRFLTTINRLSTSCILVLEGGTPSITCLQSWILIWGLIQWPLRNKLFCSSPWFIFNWIYQGTLFSRDIFVLEYTVMALNSMICKHQWHSGYNLISWL